MVVRWTFEDLTLATPTSYEFEINPSDGGSPQYKKQIINRSTCATDGQVIVQEGRDQPNETSFSGTILTEEMYNEMVSWFNKRHQIKVTDDLGREFFIYITAFEPRRVRAVQHPWKHAYTVQYIELDWLE